MEEPYASARKRKTIKRENCVFDSSCFSSHSLIHELHYTHGCRMLSHWARTSVAIEYMALSGFLSQSKSEVPLIKWVQIHPPPPLPIVATFYYQKKKNQVGNNLWTNKICSILNIKACILLIDVLILWDISVLLEIGPWCKENRLPPKRICHGFEVGNQPFKKRGGGGWGATNHHFQTPQKFRLLCTLYNHLLPN